jgi:hypothetical protein
MYVYGSCVIVDCGIIVNFTGTQLLSLENRKCTSNVNHILAVISRILDVDRLCGLVVRVSGCTTEIYCDFCEVRTEFIYVM